MMRVKTAEEFAQAWRTCAEGTEIEYFCGLVRAHAAPENRRILAAVRRAATEGAGFLRVVDLGRTKKSYRVMKLGASQVQALCDIRRVLGRFTDIPGVPAFSGRDTQAWKRLDEDAHARYVQRSFGAAWEGIADDPGYGCLINGLPYEREKGAGISLPAGAP